MNIAELFVNLGIKGSEKTVGTLGNVKKGLGDIKTVSLEAKAGIVAAMYAMERLFAASGAAGTGLTNFNALTGLSTKQLQQYQFAARQAGLSNEEFTGSLKAVQNGMTNMLLGKGAPEGLAMLANKVGFDASKARDTFYVWQQMQKFAQTAPPDVGNSVLKSFGASEGSIAAMRRNAFRPDVMGHAPMYGEKEISSLDRANVAWSNLGNKIEMAVGHFNAKHGVQLVKDISMITDSVIKLAEALQKVSDRFKVVETIGQGLEGIANTLKIIGEVSDKFSGKESKKGDLLYTPPGKEVVPGLSDSPVGKFFKMLINGGGQDIGKVGDGRTVIGGKNYVNGQPEEKLPTPWGAITPNMPAGAGAGGGTNNNVKIDQTLNFHHDGKDHAKTGDTVKKAAQDAFRQFSQGQVS